MPITDGTLTGITPQAGSDIFSLGNTEPYGVSRSKEQPSVLLGGGMSTPLNKAGVDPSGRVELTLSSETIVVPMGPHYRFNNRTQVQAVAGVTVSMSFSDPSFILADYAMAQSGGSSWQSLWTSVALTNGFAEIQGAPSGIMLSGSGRALITQQ